MATCVDLAGASYPQQRKGSSIHPMEGASLVPVFGGADLPDRPLYWEHEGNRAVRVGDWKLVAKGQKGPWELYNLKDDRSELNNRIESRPDRAGQLQELWTTWAMRANVLPWPNRGNSRKVSRKKQFLLKSNARLPRDGGVPDVAGRGFTVTVKVQTPGNGVLVGHGGTAHGYALFVREGRPVFALRRKNKLTEVVGPKTLGEGPVRVSGQVDAKGALRLLVNGTVVGLSLIHI